MANVTAPQFQQDVNNAADWANGDENTTVTMRLGQQADSPAKAIKRVDDLAAAQREDIYEKATPSVKGTFETGFTFENLFERGRFGTEPSETYWAFTGGTAGLPHVVTAGTDPTLSGPYEQVTFKDHNLLENRNAVGAHDASSINISTITNQRSVDDKINEIVSAVDEGADKTGLSSSSSAFTALETKLDKVYIPYGEYDSEKSQFDANADYSASPNFLDSATSEFAPNVGISRLADLTSAFSGVMKTTWSGQNPKIVCYVGS